MGKVTSNSRVSRSWSFSDFIDLKEDIYNNTVDQIITGELLTFTTHTSNHNKLLIIFQIQKQTL